MVVKGGPKCGPARYCSQDLGSPAIGGITMRFGLKARPHHATKTKNERNAHYFVCGGGGIRTHGEREPTFVFKTNALDHYATPPSR
jgi:hypothetical protein